MKDIYIDAEIPSNLVDFQEDLAYNLLIYSVM